MLADDIMAARGGLHDRQTYGAITNLARWIKDAQRRFVFHRDAAGAIAEVARNESARLSEALPLARPPFETCWLEFACADIFPEASHLPSAPRRMGIFIHCNKESKQTRYGCTFATSAKRETGIGVTVELLSIIVDLLKPAPQIPGMTPATYGSNSSECPPDEESLRFFEHVALRISPLMSRYHEGLGEKEAERHEEIWRNNGQSFVRITVAALCLINSRNLVEQIPSDLALLNKARTRAGKQELLSFSEVRINLSRRDQAASRAMNLSPAEIRRHIVRGHFKVRKGGIYWWRPYLRGSSAAGTVVRSGYGIGRPQGQEAGATAP